MPGFATSLQGSRYVFDSLRALLGAASAPKTGDGLAGVAATSGEQRIAARYALADLPLKTFLHDVLIPYERDSVTRLIIDSHDAAAFEAVSGLTVGAFRDWLLSSAATPETLTALAPGLTPEMVAAVSKLMRNQDLIAVARKCPAGCSPTIRPTTPRAFWPRPSTACCSAAATR